MEQGGICKYGALKDLAKLLIFHLFKDEIYIICTMIFRFLQFKLLWQIKAHNLNDLICHPNFHNFFLYKLIEIVY